MTIEMVEVDVYMSVHSTHLGRVLVSGEQDVLVPRSEADVWIKGEYALRSSDRVVEEDDGDEGGTAPASSYVADCDDGECAGADNADVGGCSDVVGEY